ncbi:MAG: folylpolyglutamate synthase/dihydrofolate synthase family protein [Lawsonella sp.]
MTDHSEHQDARNYRDVFSELDPHHELRNNPAMLGDEEAYRNLLAGDDHNVEELAAAAEKLLASRGTVDTPEAELDPHMLETLKALLADFDDQQMDSLERALAAYHDAYGEGGAVDDDDSMSAAETAAEARDFFSDYSGRIDIDTGEDAPDLGVYDDTAHPKEILDDTPTAEDYAALAAVEAELNTRWGERKIAPDLDRMRKLMDMLGHPEQATPVIQVGGTNGKSSTARMIDSLLRAMGQRVGRTTSPHLQSPTERISVDGKPITPRRYVDVWEDIKPFVEMVDAWSEEQGGPRMTKFEVLTAMAYSCFADTPVDVVVAEVGMGGRWDATNVARAEVAVICPIALDHMDYLGGDIEQIAKEKAGIIKPTEGANTAHNPHGTVAVIAHQDPKVLHVLLEHAVDVDAVVARQGMEFEVSRQSSAVGGQLLSIQGLAASYEDIFIPLFGDHQAENAAVALAAVEAFYGAHTGRPLYEKAVHSGFAAAQSPGRLERVRNAPTVLLDAAHNPHGAKALARSLDKDFDFTRLVGVVAILEDKDARGILEALEPVLDKVIVTTNSSNRAMSVADLTELALQVFEERKVDSAPTLADAIELATVDAENIDDQGVMTGAGVVITGSVVTAGDARALFKKEPA